MMNEISESPIFIDRIFITKEAIQKATSKYIMVLESCYPSRLLPNRETSLLEELSIIPLEKV